MKVRVPLEHTHHLRLPLDHRSVSWDFLHKHIQGGMKDDWLRAGESTDNLQSFHYLLWFVVESETLHWPDPKFREAPCFPLCVLLKTPVC